jgi:uncharacterized repeat protein (TIGR01451 family)
VADLSVTKAASQPNGNTASSTMSFAIVVVNAGPSTAANVTVSDAVPAGLNVLSVSGNGLTGSASGNNVSATVASLASGATATLTIVVSMSNTGSATLGYTNTASVTSTTPDPTPTNNTGTATVTVAPLADVATVVTLPANATAGTVVTGTVSYSNNGTSTAANVTGSVVVGTAGGVDHHQRHGQHERADADAGADDHAELHLHHGGERRDGDGHGDHHHRRQHADATTSARRPAARTRWPT